MNGSLSPHYPVMWVIKNRSFIRAGKNFKKPLRSVPGIPGSSEFKGFEAAAFSLNWIVRIDKPRDCIVFVFFLSSCLLGS